MVSSGAYDAIHVTEEARTNIQFGQRTGAQASGLKCPGSKTVFSWQQQTGFEWGTSSTTPVSAIRFPLARGRGPGRSMRAPKEPRARQAHTGRENAKGGGGGRGGGGRGGGGRGGGGGMAGLARGACYWTEGGACWARSGARRGWEKAQPVFGGPIASDASFRAGGSSGRKARSQEALAPGVSENPDPADGGDHRFGIRRRHRHMGVENPAARASGLMSSSPRPTRRCYVPWNHGFPGGATP